jgi:diguanylate cyclase (GGDEF)-like protein
MNPERNGMAFPGGAGVLPHEPIENLGTISILAVVDDAANERSIADRLAGRRFEVHFVRCLDRAVEALRRRPYDVLTVDLALPGEPGRSLLFRAQMLAPRIPVVLMTGHPDEELERQAVEAGVQDYLVAEEEVAVDLGRRLHHALIRHRQLRRSRQTALRLSQDPETGLTSQRVFLRKLQDALAFAERFREKPALLRVGLGDLGAVRERLGLGPTVRLLWEIGRRLTWCVRRGDSLGRLADDEIAVLLPNAATAPAVRMVAERLRLAASAPFPGGAGARVRASVGGAWFPLDGDTPDGLLRAAKVALEEAQAHGDGRWQLFPGRNLPGWPEDVVTSFRLPEPSRRDVGDGTAGAQP